jgi:DNA-directed RNA polymerase subunit omega
MKKYTIDDLLSKIDSKYALVVLVSKRAKQIGESNDRILGRKRDRLISTALKEVADGEITYEREREEKDKS